MNHEYKDQLGREFFSLGTLATLLDLSKRQTIRHIRNKNLLSVKRDKKRYVLTDDILREYPHIADRLDKMGDIPDMSSEDNVQEGTINSDIGDTSDVHMYRQDEQYENLIKRMDVIGTLATELQKVVANIRYVETDTKNTTKSIANLQKCVSDIQTQTKSKRGLWFGIILTLILIAISVAGGFGFYKIKSIHELTLINHSKAIDQKDQQMTALVREYRGLLNQYQTTTVDYENALDDLNRQVKQAQTGISFPEIDI